MVTSYGPPVSESLPKLLTCRGLETVLPVEGQAIVFQRVFRPGHDSRTGYVERDRVVLYGPAGIGLLVDRSGVANRMIFFDGQILDRNAALVTVG